MLKSGPGRIALQGAERAAGLSAHLVFWGFGSWGLRTLKSGPGRMEGGRQGGGGGVGGCSTGLAWGGADEDGGEAVGARRVCMPRIACNRHASTSDRRHEGLQARPFHPHLHVPHTVSARVQRTPRSVQPTPRPAPASKSHPPTQPQPPTRKAGRERHCGLAAARHGRVAKEIAQAAEEGGEAGGGGRGEGMGDAHTGGRQRIPKTPFGSTGFAPLVRCDCPCFITLHTSIYLYAPHIWDT